MTRRGPLDNRMGAFLMPPDSPRLQLSFVSRPFHAAIISLAGHVRGAKLDALETLLRAPRFVLSGDKTQRSLYPAPLGTSEH